MTRLPKCWMSLPAEMSGKTDDDPALVFRARGRNALADGRVPGQSSPGHTTAIAGSRGVASIDPAPADRRWVLVNALPEFSGEQELARVVVTFLDITERRRLEELERLRLDAALESIGDSILITDAEGTHPVRQSGL